MDRAEFSFLVDVLAVFDRHNIDLEFEVNGYSVSAREHVLAKLATYRDNPKPNPFKLVE